MFVIKIEELDKVNCSVVTIGTFDGLHLGHKKLLDWCREISIVNGCNWMVYTFDPHPREVLGNGNFKLITTIEEKLFLFKNFNVNNVYIKKFTKEFSQKTAQEFIEEELIQKLNLKHLVIGYDHQFGKDRKGSFEVLLSLSEKYNFQVHRLEPVFYQDIAISSTKIRHALENGNIELANEMLGYPFMLSGKVVKGLQIGRKLGFPTANIDIENNKKIIPKTGVYVVWVYVENSLFKGVMNIGYRPTLNIPEHPLSIEVYLLDYEGELYNKNLRIHILKRIRDDEKFDTVEKLKEWIKRDVDIAKKIFSTNSKWVEIINVLR